MTLKALCSRVIRSAALTAAAVALVPVISQADELDRTPASVKVSVRGMDARTAEGAQALLRRLLPPCTRTLRRG